MTARKPKKSTYIHAVAIHSPFLIVLLRGVKKTASERAVMRLMTVPMTQREMSPASRRKTPPIFPALVS